MNSKVALENFFFFFFFHCADSEETTIGLLFQPLTSQITLGNFLIPLRFGFTLFQAPRLSALKMVRVSSSTGMGPCE